MDIVSLMRSGATYDDADRAYKQGWIDRTDWDLFRFYWRNGAPRFSGVAAEFDLDPRARFDALNF